MPNVGGVEGRKKEGDIMSDIYGETSRETGEREFERKRGIN